MITTLSLDLIREDAEGIETEYEVECEYVFEPRTFDYPGDEQFNILRVFRQGKLVVVELTEDEIDHLRVEAIETLADAEDDSPIGEDE